MCGGNDRFCDFMSNYDLYTDAAAKYSSVPAQHYRRYFCEKRIPRLLLIPPHPPEPKQESNTKDQEDGEIPDPVLASYEIVEDPPSPKQFGHRVVSLFNSAKAKIDSDQTVKS